MKHTFLSALCLVPALCLIQKTEAARQQVAAHNGDTIVLSLEIVIKDSKGNQLSRGNIQKAGKGAVIKDLFFDFKQGPNTIFVYNRSKKILQEIGKRSVTAYEAPPGTEIELQGSTSNIRIFVKKPNTGSAKTDNQKNISVIIPSVVPSAPELTTPTTEEPVAPEAPPFTGSTTTEEPVAPKAPPFVKPTTVASPKESTPSRDLLEQIKAGTTLKKTTPPSNEASTSLTIKPSSVSDSLKKQIEERRKAIKEEETEENVDASEWD
ncbi:hypothetical protein JST99_05040 [Candidatus Dependentiae bacterium]|nr:hypothetical protein [Candidatus Dependentiae bacterium]MCC7415281.1 hypothetical protein [Campylobacterota bacterium]